MTENPDRQQKGQTDFRILVAFTLCLVLITLTYTFAQVISSDADIPVSSERIITNAADLEIWLNDGTQLKYLVNELVIDFEEFRPLAVRDQLVPVISNSAAVFPVFMKQAAGGFQLFNADAALIYQSRNQKPSAEAEALLVPLSELDLWLYAGELLETHSTQSQHDSLPLKNETEDQPLLKKNAVVEKEETTTAEVSDSVPEVAALPKLLERLAEELAEQQAQWFPIMPPSTNLVLTLMAQPTPTLMQVSELMDGLVSEKREDYTVYPVTGMERENKGIRERIFYNRNGELLGVVPCESDYNPSAWVENKYSDLYERDQEETDWLKNVYDPRRLNITFDLTLSRPKKVSKSRIGSKTELVSVPVRRSSGSGTNLTIGSILKTGDTVKVTVVYPASYTNRIDIYSCTDLVAGDWTLRHTTDIEASTNFVEWEDADCTNWQIYAAGNADYDGDEDGVSDAREIFITKTDPADPNDPPSIAGSISYSGFQTNTIKVIAVTDSDIWASDDSVLISQPGAYRITGLSHTGYWIKAFRDLNGDGLKDFMEASGSSVSIVSATGAMSGVNFTLTEPDTDSDGFSEYEELVIFKTDPNNGGDQYPQGTGTSVTVYYGHPSIGSTDWVYGTSAFYLYDEVSMGKGWIVGDEFVPDLHQESSTIYYGQPDYSDCPDTFVYAPDAFMNNDVSMGKGWAAQEGFVTDFRQASQQINYAQPDYFGHMDLYVYTYTANAYSEMVGRGWLRPGSFVPDLTELSHLVYWGLPSSLPQTNITKDSFILATSSLDDDVMQGTGWATPDGFLADLSSGVGPVYYGNPVGYSNIWVFGRSSFDLDNDEQIGIGWVNLYDFITYDEPDTDLDDDNQMDGYDPFVAEGYTPPNDSLTANLNLYIHDTSSFSERYALSVGPYLAVMPGTGQLAEASGQVERGTVYEDAYIESLPDGDDDGDYNAHVTGYGVYVDDPNGYLGDKTDTGFNSGKRYFDVYFPLTGISGYRPGLKTSPGSAVSRVHEDDPRYLVVMVNDDNDDGGAAGHHDYDDTVIGTNDNDIVKLTLEQFLPTALTKGTLELTVSPSNTIRLYRSNGNLLSNYTLNLANKQGDLYYLTAMDIDLYAEALTNCADVTITLAYKNTNGVEVCRDEVHLAAINIDLDADSDMDGDCSNDEEIETDMRGIIINVNNDADGGSIDCLDGVINGPEDANDLTALVLRKMQAGASRVVLLVDDETILRIFDDSGVAVLGPSILYGGPDANEYEVPLSKITAGDLSYYVECLDHGHVIASLVAYDAGNNEIGCDEVRLVGNVDRLPGPNYATIRNRICVQEQKEGVEGIEANLDSIEPLVSWGTPRYNKSTSFYVSMQKDDTSSWLQTGVRARKLSSGVETNEHYFEFVPNLDGFQLPPSDPNYDPLGYQMFVKPTSGWTGGVFKVEITDRTNGAAAAFWAGSLWESRIHDVFKTVVLENYVIGTEPKQSIARNPGQSNEHAIVSAASYKMSTNWYDTTFCTSNLWMLWVSGDGHVSVTNATESGNFLNEFNAKWLNSQSFEMWDSREW